MQCATLAEAEAASPSLVAAALLHDIGHLFESEEDISEFQTDHRHEMTGARALRGLFGEAVRGPIALHVAAKRYLCFRDPRYFQALSPASQETLRLQGGPFDDLQAAAFERLPHWREAIQLRRIDDTGKREEFSRRSFAEFLPLLRSLSLDDVKRWAGKTLPADRWTPAARQPCDCQRSVTPA